MSSTTIKLDRVPGSTGNLVFNVSLGGTATYLTNYTVAFGPGLSGVWTNTSAQITLNTSVNTANLSINTVTDGVLSDNKTLLITLASTMPVTAVNNTETLTIIFKNKESNVLSKWVSSNSPPGNLINGTYQDIPISLGASTNSFSLTSYGVVNGSIGPWGSYLTRSGIPGGGGGGGAATTLTTYVNPVGVLDPLLPTLIKFSLVSPIASPTFANQLASVLRIGDYSLVYQAYSDLTWDLYLTITNTNGSVISTALSLGINDGNQILIDVIIELLPGLVLKRIYKLTNNVRVLPDNTESSFPAPYLNRPFIPSNYNINFNLNGGTGLAAFSISQGKTFTEDLLPITPLNL